MSPKEQAAHRQQPGSFAVLFQAPPSPGMGDAANTPNWMCTEGGGHWPPMLHWRGKAASGHLG